MPVGPLSIGLVYICPEMTPILQAKKLRHRNRLSKD